MKTNCDKCYKIDGHFPSCPKYGGEILDFLTGFGKKKKCSECQFEEGHSQRCSKYKK